MINLTVTGLVLFAISMMLWWRTNMLEDQIDYLEFREEKLLKIIEAHQESLIRLGEEIQELRQRQETRNAE